MYTQQSKPVEAKMNYLLLTIIPFGLFSLEEHQWRIIPNQNIGMRCLKHHNNLLETESFPIRKLNQPTSCNLKEKKIH